MKAMLSCFDESTVMAKPWAEAGYVCICVDLQHPAGQSVRHKNIIKVGADMLTYEPPDYDYEFAAFFPPCTDVAVSGARWFKDKGLGALINALQLFKRSVDIAEKLKVPYMLENPVSTVSTYWRKPDYTFDPCDYGDPYTKKTCLWTGGGFVMPKKHRVEPTEGSKMHLLPPSEDRARLRSKTPEGFARAVFEANSSVAKRQRKQAVVSMDWCAYKKHTFYCPSRGLFCDICYEKKLYQRLEKHLIKEHLKRYDAMSPEEEQKERNKVLLATGKDKEIV